MIGILVGLVIAICGSVATTVLVEADAATAFFIGIPWGILGAFIATYLD